MSENKTINKNSKRSMKVRIYPNKTQEKNLLLAFRARQFAYHFGINDYYKKDEFYFYSLIENKLLKDKENNKLNNNNKPLSPIAKPVKAKWLNTADVSRCISDILIEIKEYNRKLNSLLGGEKYGHKHQLSYLLEVKRSVLTQAIQDYGKALNAHFESIRKTGKPCFPKFYSLDLNKTARIQIDRPATNKKHIDSWSKNKLRVGDEIYRYKDPSNLPKQVPSSVTITQNSYGQYFASFISNEERTYKCENKQKKLDKRKKKFNDLVKMGKKQNRKIGYDPNINAEYFTDSTNLSFAIEEKDFKKDLETKLFKRAREYSKTDQGNNPYKGKNKRNREEKLQLKKYFDNEVKIKLSPKTDNTLNKTIIEPNSKFYNKTFSKVKPNENIKTKEKYILKDEDLPIIANRYKDKIAGRYNSNIKDYKEPSKRSIKAKKALAKVYNDRKNQKEDFQHKKTKIIAALYPNQAREYLDVAKLIEKNGEKQNKLRAAQNKEANNNNTEKEDNYKKYNLSRNFLYTAMAGQRSLMEDRFNVLYGSTKNIITLPKFERTTQCCSNCKEERLVVPRDAKTWECPYCLFVHMRDECSSKNILDKGFKKEELSANKKINTNNLEKPFSNLEKDNKTNYPIVKHKGLDAGKRRRFIDSKKLDIKFGYEFEDKLIRLIEDFANISIGLDIKEKHNIFKIK